MSHRFAMVVARLAVACAAGLFGALPASAALPAAASAAANGQAVVLDGVLQVEVADFPDRTAIHYHFLKTDSGQRHELRFKNGHVPRLVSGTRVRVRGNLKDHILTAEASLTPIGPVPTEGAAALPYAAGAQSTAVILVNFQDKVTSPQTPATVQSLVFGQVSNFLLENSFQTTSLAGKVFGWYTIPVASTNCDIGAIKTYAQKAAAAGGADLSAYSRFIYIFPNTAACGWAGYGMIGGSPTDAWINGYFDRRVIAHEVGHNLGLFHAHSQDCGGAVTTGTCTTSEYGDLVDTMGWGLYGHFSAYQKEALGWLNYGGMPPITTVQASGTYTLAPYVGSTGGARALKILKSTNPSTGEKTWYYLEYRQPTGFDSSLAGNGNLTSGVTIRTGSASGGVFLLDMTPGSDGSSEYNDLKDGALAVGRTYTDSAAGFSATVTRADATGATVNVTLGNTTTCVRARPTVTISPAQSSALAGTAVQYTVTITNNDTTPCSAWGINLARTVPSGWSGTLGTASLSVLPGRSGATTLTVPSPATAAAGTYSLGVSANNVASGLTGTGSATYTVNNMNPALTETVSVAQTSYTRGSTVTSVATVKSNGLPVANASVAFRLTKANGATVDYSTTTNAGGQASFPYAIGTTDPAGTWRAGATAASGGTTVYTSVNFTVQ